MGISFISIHELVAQCIQITEIGRTWLVCTQCPCNIDDGVFRLQSSTVIAGAASRRRPQLGGNITVSHLIYATMDTTHHPCYRCVDIRLLNRILKLDTEASLLAFEIVDHNFLPEPMLSLDTMNSTRKLYTLRGLAYHGSNHFTCRVVDPQGQVWYNDGAITGNSSTLEGNLNASSNLTWLQKAHGKTLIYVFYAVHV
jgi:hypothetical protein